MTQDQNKTMNNRADIFLLYDWYKFEEERKLYKKKFFRGPDRRTSTTTPAKFNIAQAYYNLLLWNSRGISVHAFEFS